MFDDPVKVVIDHLATSLSVPVGGRVPNPRPARFVRCELASLPRTSPVHREAGVIIECWETSNPDALAFGGEVEVAICELQQPYNWVPALDDPFVIAPHYMPDPDTELPRIVMTVRLRQRMRNA